MLSETAAKQERDGPANECCQHREQEADGRTNDLETTPAYTSSTLDADDGTRETVIHVGIGWLLS